MRHHSIRLNVFTLHPLQLSIAKNDYVIPPVLSNWNSNFISSTHYLSHYHRYTKVTL